MTGMYRSSAHPSRRWMWFPIVAAGAFVALFVVVWAHFGPFQATYAGAPFPVWWFPFGWFVFIPFFFIAFFALRWFLWGGWGWGWGGWGWYRGWYADPALETLRERFARGEITKERFDQMRQDLER